MDKSLLSAFQVDGQVHNRVANLDNQVAKKKTCWSFDLFVDLQALARLGCCVVNLDKKVNKYYLSEVDDLVVNLVGPWLGLDKKLPCEHKSGW